MLKERIYKYKFSIGKINQTEFFILINKFKNYLILKIDLNIIANILNRKSHINNCIIGFNLNWEIYPKNHYNSELNGTLNFLHK